MTFTLLDGSGKPFQSERPGTLGGHRANRVYGRLDCPGALRWIARGHYVSQRVFFADEATARSAGYRPCATCMPAAYETWKDRRSRRVFDVYESPVGPLLLSGEADVLTGLAFDDASAAGAGWSPDRERFAAERRQLDEYFAGARTAFDFPLRLDGGPFERRVWEALLAIPYGTTTTYGEIAARLDAAEGARAVGSANGRNPIAIVVPCHRVIGARGHLTGYGGGLDRKRALLALEGAMLPV